jgi:hypothetical protein
MGNQGVVRPSTKNKAPAASRQQIMIAGLAVVAIVCWS